METRTDRVGGQNPDFKMATLESLDGELHVDELNQAASGESGEGARDYRK